MHRTSQTSDTLAPSTPTTPITSTRTIPIRTIPTTRRALTALSTLLLCTLALPLSAQTAALSQADSSASEAAGAGAAAGASQATSAVPAEAAGAIYLLRHPLALARFLRLSAEQKATLVSLHQTLETAVAPLRQDRVPLCQQLSADLAAGSPDAATIGAAALALYNNKQSIVAARKSFDSSFSAILDPTQLASYDALKTLVSDAYLYFSPVGQCEQQPA
jgi:hypothetical protein